MKDVKAPTSKSYHLYLIEALQDPERAAGNIEVALELAEKNPQPQLLQLTLKDVIDARLQMNNFSEAGKGYYEELNQLLSVGGGNEIYTLVALLDELGFRLEVKTNDTNC